MALIWPSLPRRPQALASAVGRNAQAANDGPDAVAVGQGPLEGLHDHGHVTFAADQPVGIGVEGTAARRAHGSGVGEQDQRIRLAVRGPADDGHVDAAELQGTAPQQQRRAATRRKPS